MKKKSNLKMLEKLQIRLTVQEKNQIRARASIYAKGNISWWVIHSALTAPGQYLTETDKKKQKRP